MHEAKLSGLSDLETILTSTLKYTMYIIMTSVSIKLNWVIVTRALAKAS